MNFVHLLLNWFDRRVGKNFIFRLKEFMNAQFEAAQYVHEEAKVFRHNAKIEVRGACRFKII